MFDDRGEQRGRCDGAIEKHRQVEVGGKEGDEVEHEGVDDWDWDSGM